jgi:hypothetical protein
MRPGGGALSRDPNVCASCSSLIDGLSEHQRTALEMELEREVQAATPENLSEIAVKNLTSQSA